MSASRISSISAHLNPSSELSPVSISAKSHVKSPDDVVIVSALRTPIARGKKGSFKDTTPDDLLAAVLKGVVERAKLDPSLVDDIQVGNVLPPGGGAANARMASFFAGFPVKTSVMTVNRQCSSGLQACANVVSAIQSGFIDIGIGAGVESMTKGWGKGDYEFSDNLSDFPEAADCTIPMGVTSENVAAEFGISRERQDRFSVESHKRAAKAQKAGLFKSEIVPVTVKVLDETGAEKTITLTEDEGIREQTTFESLSKLTPSFKKDGTTTAGNSSQVSDGAAAVLFMKRSTAQKLNLPIIGRFVTFVVVGVPPKVMGIGPAFAIPEALKKAGLTKDDIDVFEINEAFASQALYSCEKLGLDMNKVNPLGGAIALGHPLGCTGARQIATLLPELTRRKGRFGVTSMCIGTGMGAASIIERE